MWPDDAARIPFDVLVGNAVRELLHPEEGTTVGGLNVADTSSWEPGELPSTWPRGGKVYVESICIAFFNLASSIGRTCSVCGERASVPCVVCWACLSRGGPVHLQDRDNCLLLSSVTPRCRTDPNDLIREDDVISRRKDWSVHLENF